MPSGSWANGWVTADVVTAAEFRKGVGNISDTTLGASAASFDITGIVATYANLMIVMFLRSDQAATLSSVNVRFNNDASANYDYETINASGTSVAGAESLGATGLYVGDCAGNTATAAAYTPIVMWVPAYAGAGAKGFNSLAAPKSGTTTGLIGLRIHGGQWRTAATAINRITVYPGVGNFVTSSRLSIYAMGS